MSEAERYSLRDEARVERGMEARTADDSGSFFLQHLRAGANVLDCGCGPGTITIGLAKSVHAGQVVGVDIQADQVARARSLAEQNGVLNASYCTASVYELPFADEAFDAVFANALLIHLRAPERAIDEMRRVVKQGGLVGIRDADRGFDLRLPETPALKEMFELWIRVLRHNGGSPFYARRQRQLLVNAGFQQTSVGAAPVVYGNLEATRRNAQGTRNVFVGLMRTAVQEGWVDQTRVDEICEEIVAWGERPEAFGQTLWFWALGWK